MIVHFSAHISKWELVCKFGVIFHIFIISCLCSRFHVRNQWFFYSVITFSYIKCFVHSYTVDVVFTLSYLSIQWLRLIYVSKRAPRGLCQFHGCISKGPLSYTRNGCHYWRWIPVKKCKKIRPFSPTFVVVILYKIACHVGPRDISVGGIFMKQSL